MDYEKKYKSVLQTATQWIKDGCTDKEKICLECVFPELKESEDERVREWLINYFSSFEIWRSDWDITPNTIIAYLEKQKEQKTIPWYDYKKSKEAGYTIVPNEEYERLVRKESKSPQSGARRMRKP